MPRPAILNLGFRLFFFSASVFSLFVMSWWLVFYTLHHPLPTGQLSPLWWHGHEMIFGYSAAVVTGFLFTAVQNWTGVAMPKGIILLLYWLPWFIARLIFSLAPQWLSVAVFFDCLFAAGSFFAVFKAVLAVKQWRQMGIVSKLFLMIVANGLFLAGLLGGLANGIYLSLYLGIFLILAIIFTIGRRVTPFFIGRGVGYPFEPKNSTLVDRLCLITFTVFFVLKLFTNLSVITAFAALATALCNAYRLWGWHTRGIWRKPLLWSMFLSFLGMIVGFFLFALQPIFPIITDSLALHALALAGIGLLTVSMIGRVSLGHSGRNIHQPPKLLIISLILMVFSFFFRIIMPLALPTKYVIWIAHAQAAWLIAFLLLVIAYSKIWFSPRIDGKAG